MSASIWPVNNSVVLKLEGLRNRAGIYQNSATVQLTALVDARGQSVSGITYPLTLTYVAASNGDYEVTITASAGVTKGRRYRGTIRATSGSLQYEAVEQILAQERND